MTMLLSRQFGACLSLITTTEKTGIEVLKLLQINYKCKLKTSWLTNCLHCLFHLRLSYYQLTVFWNDIDSWLRCEGEHINHEPANDNTQTSTHSKIKQEDENKLRNNAALTHRELNLQTVRKCCISDKPISASWFYSFQCNWQRWNTQCAYTRGHGQDFPASAATADISGSQYWSRFRSLHLHPAKGSWTLQSHKKFKIISLILYYHEIVKFKKRWIFLWCTA